MAPVVIADAGPLIALAKADLLDTLQTLFGRVHLPSAVYSECTFKSDPASEKIQQAVESRVLILENIDTGANKALPRSLGEGEKQAIYLAMSYEKPLLIMDDRLARKQVAKQGIDFIGTVRLLDIAERQSVIQSAQLAIETMRSEGYRISLELLQSIRENS